MSILMKRVMHVVALAVLLLCVSVQAQMKSAEEVVKEVADEVFVKVNSAQEMLDTDPSKMYDLVNEVIVPHFDFLSISKWILGKANWRAVSTDQQQQFVNEIKILLVRTYAKALQEYSVATIEYLSTDSSTKPTLAVVKTKFNRSGLDPFTVDYRMRFNDERWQVIDVVLDGVSLVSAYRGSFLPQIKKSGFDALVASLSQRNDVALGVKQH